MRLPDLWDEEGLLLGSSSSSSLSPSARGTITDSTCRTRQLSSEIIHHTDGPRYKQSVPLSTSQVWTLFFRASLLHFSLTTATSSCPVRKETDLVSMVIQGLPLLSSSSWSIVTHLLPRPDRLAACTMEAHSSVMSSLSNTVSLISKLWKLSVVVVVNLLHSYYISDWVKLYCHRRFLLYVGKSLFCELLSYLLFILSLKCYTKNHKC